MDLKFTKNLIKLMAGVAAVGLVAIAPKASAATETFSQSISSTDTNWTALTLNLQTFDANLGTLTSVEIILSGSATTTISVTNNGEGDSSGEVQTQVKFKLSDPDSFIGTAAKISLDLPLDPEDPGTNATYSLTSGGNIVLGAFNGTDIYDQSFTNGALAEFTTSGTGSIALVTTATANTVLSNTGGNTSATQATTASEVATVIYHYDAIPEPGTYALVAMGLALGGVVLLRNRRAAAKA